MKRAVSILLSVYFLATYPASGSGCLIHSCNPSISYAMGKERGALSKRLGELNRGIRVMATKNKALNLLYKKEIKELRRLVGRYKMRVIDLKKRTHSFVKHKEERWGNSLYETTQIK